MTYLIVLCFIYILIMIECSAGISITSKGACGPNEKNCFRYSFNNVTELKKKMKNDTKLRELLRKHVHNMCQKTTTTPFADKENGTPTTQPTVATPIVTPESICESDESKMEGWQWINGFCLYISKQNGKTANYTEAEFYCKQMGGRLATAGIRDNNIANYLTINYNFPTKTTFWTIWTFWIGLQFVNEVWKWSDNATYIKNDTNWDVGEPDKIYEENCTVIHSQNQWRIHDFPCGHSTWYICEK